MVWSTPYLDLTYASFSSLLDVMMVFAPAALARINPVMETPPVPVVRQREKMNSCGV
jgi:hypothetical protein